MAQHVLVVGGTGMLAGVVSSLAAEGADISLLSRRASRHACKGVRGYDCDYGDDAGFEQALDRALAASGPVDVAVAWFHTLKIAAPRRLAQGVGRPGAPGLYVQVLGSATADPARPDRLRTAAAVAQGLPDCRLRQVVLGFRVEGERSRWLSDAEICGGVLGAIRSDREFSVVGQVEPWARRPGG